MKNSQTKKPNKYVALATYLFAVICLLLGLFLPLFGGKEILALQLPDVINKLANKNLITVKNEFSVSYPINFLGLGVSTDIMAWVVFIYAVITVLSLLALIPIGISTKKGGKAACVFMYIIEAAAVAVLSVYVMIALQYQGISVDLPIGSFCYNLLIALCGPLLMLIILSCMNKKGTGAVKLVLFILSSIGLLVLFNFAQIIPKLASIKIAPALYKSGEASAYGIDYLTLLFNGLLPDIMKALPDAKNKALIVLGTITALIVVINFLIDSIAIATNAKRTGLIFNFIRYGLEAAAIICLFITVAVCKYGVGLMLIILAAVAVIELAVNVIRFLLYGKKAVKTAENETEQTEQTEQTEVKTEEKTEAVIVPAAPVNEDVQTTILTEEPLPEVLPDDEEPEEEQEISNTEWDEPAWEEPEWDEPVQMEIIDVKTKPVVNEPVREIREISEQPAPTPPPVQTIINEPTVQTHVYTINTIYGGPVDDFMRKLTNDEKIEFAMTFIEKKKGNIGNIPEYVIGGNNKLFFSSVFIYLGRIRGLISDGLLNKMYKELNML